MSSQYCRIVMLAVLSAALLCNSFTFGGPAHSFALIASRAAKIPRTIRAPFTNSEMMTARGFGKRSSISKFKENEGPWNGAKAAGEAKFYNDMVNDAENNQVDETFNDAPTESFPLDWLANEMTQNPALAQTILQQFVDSNHNGIITIDELLSNAHGASRNGESITASGSASADLASSTY